MAKVDVAKLREILLEPPPVATIKPTDWLSSGSTLINLTCSGKYNGAFVKGHYYFLVGDSQSGKTFLTLTCFAEAARNPAFADYKFVFDNVEGGALMDMERYFGADVVKRLRPARVEDGVAMSSRSIEEFYYNFDDAVTEGPVIYVVDSMDALTSKDDEKLFAKRKAAYQKGKPLKTGDFGDGKAKINSRMMRRSVHKMHKNGSILIVINQTRDNVNAGLFGPKKTRSGGRSLTFYATLELWTSVGPAITREYRGVKYKLGVVAKCVAKKNRLTGKERMVSVPILYDLGIDDVGGCIDYLISTGHWKSKDSKVKADDFGFVGERADLVAKIENESLEQPLGLLVQEVWDNVEDALSTNRKPRYS